MGLIGSYSFSNYYYPGNYIDTSKSVHYTAGVFYRKYKKLANKFYFFGEVDAVYAHAKNTRSYSQSESKYISHGAVISLNPGISYSIWKRMQVELIVPDIITLSYSHDKTDYYSDTPLTTPSEKQNIFSVNTNNSNVLSSFGIGFKFLLGK